VEAVQAVLRTCFEARAELQCDGPMDMLPRDRARLLAAMPKTVSSGRRANDDVIASRGRSAGGKHGSIASRLIDTACCALVKAGVLRQVDGFAVPLADVRHFFRFVYSVVAASDDDVRRLALDVGAARASGGPGPASSSGAVERSAPPVTRADRVVQASASLKVADAEASEAAASLAGTRSEL